jgi:hypothetical protein
MTRTTCNRSRAKKSPPRRPRQLQLINAATGECIGTFDSVVDAFRGNAQFLRGQENHVITVIREV